MARPPAKILVIDDEAAICFAFERFFGARGYTILTAGTGSQGLDLCRAEDPDVAFVDVRLPDADGLNLISGIQQIVPESCIIVISAYGSMELVARAIREKAFDCLAKPLDLDRANELVEQFIEARRARADSTPVENEIQTSPRDSLAVIGNSAAMQAVFKAVARAAATDAAVLLYGETGTGKDLMARSIHSLSARSARPFVAVNCGALPETLVESELFGHRKGSFTGAEEDKTGRFEAAEGGTLFLDEIGELPLSSQVKLLRFLDSHKIERLGDVASRQLDVRIIAATNRPLAEAMREGRFRQDLYYRLAVLEIGIPPLRNRRDDIVPLARHFIGACSAASSLPALSAEAARMLEDYSWPGNVRELRNAVEHALTMSTDNSILPVHIPHHIREAENQREHSDTRTAHVLLDEYLRQICTGNENLYEKALRPLEAELIRRVMADCDGNQSEAAKRLGLHRNTLRHKLRDLAQVSQLGL